MTADPWTGTTPQSLRDLALPPGCRLLLLGPHPDDFDAIGVTLRLLHDRGHPLHAGVAMSGSGVEDSYRPGLDLSGKARLRVEEQRRSIRLFGLPENALTLLDLENAADDQMLDTPANQAQLAKLITTVSPLVVFLPHGQDTNPAHRAMYAMVRRSATTINRPLALALIRDPKTIAMTTRWFVPFDQVEADWKAALLRCHDTQHQRNLNTRGHGFDHRILDHNRQIARELGLAAEYAEAFELELHHWPTV